MELLELMKTRRSIRKYQDRQISREDMETIVEAGTYAPNAGGGQPSIIDDPAMKSGAKQNH